MKPVQLSQFHDTKSILTRQDYDEYNFIYALLRLLFPQEKRTAFSTLKAKYFDKFDLHGVKAPLGFRDIKKLVKQNSWIDATVNLVYFSGKQCFPFKLIGQGSKVLSFLFIRESSPDGFTSHFFPIVDFDTFMTPVTQKGRKQKKHWCGLLASVREIG